MWVVWVFVLLVLVAVAVFPLYMLNAEEGAHCINSDLHVFLMLIHTSHFTCSPCVSYAHTVPPLVAPRLPIDSPRITPVSSNSLRLSWHPARIPAYARKSPITYVVEMKDPAASVWSPVISKLDDTNYQVEHEQMVPKCPLLSESESFIIWVLLFLFFYKGTNKIKRLQQLENF